MDSAYQTVVHHLEEHLGVDPATVTPETTLEQLELDSLSILELGLVLQDETGIKQLDEGAVTFQTTVGAIASTLENLQAAQAAEAAAVAARPAGGAPEVPAQPVGGAAGVPAQAAGSAAGVPVMTGAVPAETR